MKEKIKKYYEDLGYDVVFIDYPIFGYFNGVVVDSKGNTRFIRMELIGYDEDIFNDAKKEAEKRQLDWAYFWVENGMLKGKEVSLWGEYEIKIGDDEK